jgi:predicted enzyme related to lactoylglutathione lyase
MLARVEPAGGKIITRRGALTAPNSYFASVQDTEGNQFGLVWQE